MTWLTENPTPVVVLGIVIEAILVVVLMKTGRREALWGIILTAAATIALVVANFMIVTPREEVTTALEEIRQLVERNDRPELVKRIHPASIDLRNRAQLDLAQVTVERASIDKLFVNVHEDNESADVTFNGVVVVREGMSKPLPLRFKVEMDKLEGVWVVSRADWDFRKLGGGDTPDETRLARPVTDGAG